MIRYQVSQVRDVTGVFLLQILVTLLTFEPKIEIDILFLNFFLDKWHTNSLNFLFLTCFSLSIILFQISFFILMQRHYINTITDCSILWCQQWPLNIDWLSPVTFLFWQLTSLQLYQCRNSYSTKAIIYYNTTLVDWNPAVIESLHILKIIYLHTIITALLHYFFSKSNYSHTIYYDFHSYYYRITESCPQDLFACFYYELCYLYCQSHNTRTRK